jgi:hypothetical protein
MAFVEDVLESGNIMTGVAIGALSLVLPAIFPAIRGPMIAVLTAGATLFVEAEFEVEGEAVEALVETTMEVLSEAVAGSETELHQAAETTLRQFTHRARTRSNRWGRDEKDRAARHRRHTTALKRAMERQSKKWPAAQHGVIARLAEGVIEDW